MRDNGAYVPSLTVKSLRKEYRQPDGSTAIALRLDSLAALGGEAIAVTGPSGSGKTTLLRLLAALIRPSGGEISFNGQDLSLLGPSEARWRASAVGYVCQEMNLLPDFSVMENMMLAGEISGMGRAAARERAAALLRRLGIGGKAGSRPSELSLGERQRAAVARAVLHSPPLVLADEPTASLDAENSRVVMKVLLELCSESSSLLLVATHDDEVIKLLPREIPLKRSEAPSP
ncbi:MAG: ATP-binding cassette domain-containing protein [Synergistaceae bacterium]|nr:ATP-binding cassette domain-containing protein [Synergistaceae bacterium]